MTLTPSYIAIIFFLNSTGEQTQPPDTFSRIMPIEECTVILQKQFTAAVEVAAKDVLVIGSCVYVWPPRNSQESPVPATPSNPESVHQKIQALLVNPKIVGPQSFPQQQ